MENARFKVDVEVDEHALHEVYLPHFKKVIDAGADSVMSAYNSVNGEWAGENRQLLTDILRNEWGFQGFVTSDWVWGIRDGVKSLQAGMDVEMPLRMIRARELPSALRDGRLKRETIENAARRVIATTLRHLVVRDCATPEKSVVAGADHRALARLVATRGCVLLKNEPVGSAPMLPLTAATQKTVAVIGRLATTPNLGDHGSSNVHPPSTCSVLEGLREVLPHVTLLHSDGSDIDVAVNMAALADSVILVVGMTHDDEGEHVSNDNLDGLALFGFPFNLRLTQWLLKQLARKAAAQFSGGGDRKRLTLHPNEEKLITAVSRANPRTVAILIGGSAIVMENWRSAVPAILLAWYPGMEGGRAIADILLGTHEPGGRLPFAIPTEGAHLPFFDADATHITYGARWGQRLLDRDENPAAYRFGHGLGYTKFNIILVRAEAASRAGTADVLVENVGARDGAAVIEIYAFDANAILPVAQLVGFKRIELRAGAQGEVCVKLDLTPLHKRSPATKSWSRRDGSWKVMAAQVSPDRDAIDRSLAGGLAAAI